MKKKSKQKYPPGWDEKRVREVAEYYENQSDEEHLAETRKMPPPHKLYTDSNGVMRGYYVYLHRDRATGAVFYVGKGAGRRAWKNDGRHCDWYAKVASLTDGWEVEIARQDLSELEAFDLEIAFVKEHGGCQADGGTLVNIGPGGESLAACSMEIEYDDGGWSAAYEDARKFKEFSREHQESLVGGLSKELDAIVAALDGLGEEAAEIGNETMADNAMEIDCIVGTVCETCSDFLRRRLPWKTFGLTLEEACEDLLAEAREIANYHRKLRPLLKEALRIARQALIEIDTGNRQEAEDIAARATCQTNK